MAIQINGTSGISGVDGSAATPALQGSDTNTGISFGTDEVNINTGGTTRAKIDSSGRLLVGTSSARTNFHGGGVAYQQQIEGTAYNTSAPAFICDSNTAGHGPHVTLARSRGTSVGSNTVVQSGDVIGVLNFQGNDGTNFVNCARILTAVDGTPGSNDMPGRLVFSTTADGASSPTERMRISANGNILFQPDGNGITIYSFSTGAGTSTVKYNYNTGALTYDASNRYVKDNIVDCPYGIAEIKQLQPRKYFRIDDQINEIGFIADEVSEVMPEFVSMGVKSIATKNPEDTEIVPLAVNYEKMTAVLTKALQEAITKIETLETRLTALEGGTN